MRRLLLVLPALLTACQGMVGEMPDDDDAGLAVDAGHTFPDDAGHVTHDAGLPVDDDAGLPPDDAGVPEVDAGPPSRVPVLVLVGKQGRRAISCDDGRTWKNDVSFDDAWPEAERYRCWQSGFTLPDGGTPSTDCDHNAYSSTSLSFSRGTFFQTTGWGAPGKVYRSTDGITWTSSDVSTTQNVMHGATRSILASRSSAWSDDDGVTWQTNKEIPVTSAGGDPIWNIRGGEYGDGTFLVLGLDGSNIDMLASDDDGAHWRRPTLDDGSRADVCGAGRVTFANGTFLAFNVRGSDLIVCRSVDHAHTFTVHVVGPNPGDRSPTVWTGSEFRFWSPGKAFRSADGATWTVENTQTRVGGVLQGGPNIGAVTITPEGAFAGVRGGWNVWYDDQRFYRSTDGLIWDELPVSAYHRGHPVTGLVTGLAERSTACP